MTTLRDALRRGFGRRRPDDFAGTTGHATLQLLAETSGDVFFNFGADGSLRYVSPSVEGLYGVTPAEMYASGGDIVENQFTHPEDALRIQDAMRQLFKGELDRVKIDFRIRHADGHWLWVQSNANLIRDEDSGERQLIIVTRDISDKKQMEAELQKRALTDGLTGLPNRRAFDEAWTNAWAETSVSGDLLSVLMIDIDHFKAFNDVHGHLLGDDCLRAVAQAIAGATPDDAVAARFGGEEFSVLLRETSAENARRIAEDIREAVARTVLPKTLKSDPKTITVSIGVATSRPAELRRRDQSDVISAADDALYAAKRGGRNRVATPSDGGPLTE